MQSMLKHVRSSLCSPTLGAGVLDDADPGEGRGHGRFIGGEHVFCALARFWRVLKHIGANASFSLQPFQVITETTVAPVPADLHPAELSPSETTPLLGHHEVHSWH
jgi:hypothetical protein